MFFKTYDNTTNNNSYKSNNINFDCKRALYF